MNYRPSRGYFKVGKYEGVYRMVFVRTLILLVFFAVQGFDFFNTFTRIAREKPEVFAKYDVLTFIQPFCAWLSFFLCLLLALVHIMCVIKRVFSGVSSRNQLEFTRLFHVLTVLLTVTVSVQLLWTSFIYYLPFVLGLSLYYMWEMMTITPALTMLTCIVAYNLKKIVEVKKDLTRLRKKTPDFL